MSTQIPESNESTGMLEKIKAIAKQHFEGARSSHRWDHTLRVCRLSRHIAEKEGADPEIVQAAALLHDIARSKEDRSKGSLCHAEEGAKMAGEILKDLGMAQQQVEAVVHCIGSHRYRDERQPETPEAKVLFDADKLDSIGAVGIGRAFLFSGEIGAKLHNDNLEKVEKMFERAYLPPPSYWDIRERDSGQIDCSAYWTQKESKILFQYMGEPLPGFQYKWI